MDYYFFPHYQFFLFDLQQSVCKKKLYFLFFFL